MNEKAKSSFQTDRKLILNVFIILSIVASIIGILFTYDILSEGPFAYLGISIFVSANMFASLFIILRLVVGFANKYIKAILILAVTGLIGSGAYISYLIIWWFGPLIQLVFIICFFIVFLLVRLLSKRWGNIRRASIFNQLEIRKFILYILITVSIVLAIIGSLVMTVLNETEWYLSDSGTIMTALGIILTVLFIILRLVVGISNRYIKVILILVVIGLIYSVFLVLDDWFDRGYGFLILFLPIIIFVLALFSGNLMLDKLEKQKPLQVIEAGEVIGTEPLKSPILTCTRCGSKIAETDIFCKGCGITIEEE